MLNYGSWYIETNIHKFFSLWERKHSLKEEKQHKEQGLHHTKMYRNLWETLLCQYNNSRKLNNQVKAASQFKKMAEKDEFLDSAEINAQKEAQRQTHSHKWSTISPFKKINPFNPHNLQDSEVTNDPYLIMTFLHIKHQLKERWQEVHLLWTFFFFLCVLGLKILLSGISGTGTIRTDSNFYNNAVNSLLHAHRDLFRTQNFKFKGENKMEALHILATE